MEKLDQQRSASENGKSVSQGRRFLLKAGWAIPVIAVTPLMNTASAVSSINCNDYAARLREAAAQQNEDLHDAILEEMKAGGCTFD